MNTAGLEAEQSMCVPCAEPLHALAGPALSCAPATVSLPSGSMADLVLRLQLACPVGPWQTLYSGDS